MKGVKHTTPTLNAFVIHIIQNKHDVVTKQNVRVHLFVGCWCGKGKWQQFHTIFVDDLHAYLRVDTFSGVFQANFFNAEDDYLFNRVRVTFDRGQSAK